MRSIFAKNVSKCLGLLCAAACIGFVSEGWGSRPTSASKTIKVDGTVQAFIDANFFGEAKNLSLTKEDGTYQDEDKRTTEHTFKSNARGYVKITGEHKAKLQGGGKVDAVLPFIVKWSTDGTNWDTWEENAKSDELTNWKTGDKAYLRVELEDPAILYKLPLGKYEAEITVELSAD